MSKYQVGDVAALFSKPKEPTSAAGKKLHSLFEEFHGGKRKSAFKTQLKKDTTSTQHINQNKKNEDFKTLKKNKKRKFSDTIVQESDQNADSTIKKEKNVPENKFDVKKKNENNSPSEMNFPRKKKRKMNSFNSNSFVEPQYADDVETVTNSKLNNGIKMKKARSSFLKKSKHKVTADSGASFCKNNAKNATVKNNAEAPGSDDDSLKNEVNEFIKQNSKKPRKAKSSKIHSKHDSAFEKQHDFLKTPDLQSVKKDVLPSYENSPSKNKHKSKTNSNVEMSLSDQNQVSDFIRNPKRKQAANYASGNGKVGNKTVKVGRGEVFNNNCDTLFKSGNENYGKNKDKKFKRKSNNFSNSVQNSKTELSEKSEPGFISVPDCNPEDDDRLSRTLFVGNLPVNMKRKLLHNLFSPFGQIESVRYFGIETNKAKVFSENAPKSMNPSYAADSIPGFIVFKERQNAIDALSLSGTIFKDRHITVDLSVPAGTSKLYDDKRTIFIGNLPFGVKDESVWNAFTECGKIERVRVVRDRETGIGKGFGYVMFNTIQSKENALALQNLEIEGREIRIKAVDSNKPTQKSKVETTIKRDTFKSRAIRLKKNNKNPNSRKSIKKLMKREKTAHKKKKIASVLQKSMKQ